MNKTTLYIKDNRGQLRFWSVEPSIDTLEIEYGVWGGEILYQTKDVRENQSGRDMDEQMELEMDSLIKKKMDKGYVTDREATELPRTNRLGLARPMLASPIARVKAANFDDALVQLKYDGHRCMIHNNAGELIAYSRNGKPINTISHILNSIIIPEGWTLDGELYVHGKPLQTITSLVKKIQPDNEMLEFKCYDVIVPEEPNADFRTRFTDLMSNVEFNRHSAYKVPTWRYSAINNHKKFQDAKAMGYEGLIVRLAGSPYEDGKRSKALLKIKSVIDDEFEVVDIKPSKDGWAILECIMLDGTTFSVSAPGNIQDKTMTYRSKHLFIGRMVRVEFANFTKSRKPFHPVATNWRDKDAE